MNPKNLEYLTEHIKNAGFPEAVIQKLKERLKDAPADFSIEYQPDFGDHAVIAILHFKNWKETDLYYFHRYHLILSRENTSDCLQQVFYCGKHGPVIELVKGYNLLCGRAVYREKLLSHLKEEYNAWVQLNFMESDSRGNFRLQYFHDGYGFDLPKTLENFPFLELSDPDLLNQLISGLRQGNREAVTVSLDGKINTYYVEALPQYKSMKIYDTGNRQLSGKALMLIVALSQQGDPVSIPETVGEKDTVIREASGGKKGKVQSKRIRA